jgi:hypothetical protein
VKQQVLRMYYCVSVPAYLYGKETQTMIAADKQRPASGRTLYPNKKILTKIYFLHYITKPTTTKLLDKTID